MNISAKVDVKAPVVLLVDDDDGDAKAIERAFRHAKIANPLQRAIDGMEALEMLKGTGGKEKIPSHHIFCWST